MRNTYLVCYDICNDKRLRAVLFGHRVNYRRVLEIQARLLARVIEGEISRYRGFETR